MRPRPDGRPAGPARTGVQVLGFGPGAMGLIVAADRMGALDELLAGGILFLERAGDLDRLCGSRFPFRIHSNSIAIQFVESISKRGRLAGIWKKPNTRYIFNMYKRTVPLERVGALMRDLTEIILRVLEDSGHGRLILGTRVESVVVDGNGAFLSEDDSGRAIALSPNLVLATGASEDPGELAAGGRGSPALPSSDILSGEFHGIGRELAAGKRVAIVGGSHSGFACADTLLREFGGLLSDGQILLAHRPIKLYYESPREALLDGYAFKECDLSDRTGEINKFDGLRGQAKRLYLELASGRERRIELVAAERFAPESLPGGVAAVVHAIGYSPRSVKFRRQDGSGLRLARDSRNTEVGSDGRVKLEAAGSLPGLFAIGLGHGRREGGMQPQVGVNFFHGRDGETIVRQLLRGNREREAGSRVHLLIHG